MPGPTRSPRRLLRWTVAAVRAPAWIVAASERRGADVPKFWTSASRPMRKMGADSALSPNRLSSSDCLWLRASNLNPKSACVPTPEANLVRLVLQREVATEAGPTRGAKPEPEVRLRFFLSLPREVRAAPIAYASKAGEVGAERSLWATPGPLFFRVLRKYRDRILLFQSSLCSPQRRQRPSAFDPRRNQTPLFGTPWLASRRRIQDVFRAQQQLLGKAVAWFVLLLLLLQPDNRWPEARLSRGRVLWQSCNGLERLAPGIEGQFGPILARFRLLGSTGRRFFFP